TLAMAPIDPLRLTGRNKADCAAQAAAFKLLGGAAHDLILRLCLVSVSTKDAAFLGCTRTDRTASSCSGHDLQPRHTRAERPVSVRSTDLRRGSGQWATCAVSRRSSIGMKPAAFDPNRTVALPYENRDACAALWALCGVD